MAEQYKEFRENEVSKMELKNTKHKAGIIGYGNMGSWHAENINSRIEQLEVDDVCHVLIGFENGLKAQIVAGLWCYVAEPRWEEYYENVIAVIEGKAEPIVTHDQIRRAMKILDVAFESARTNQTVAIEQ